MHDRPPGRAVALEVNLPRGKGPRRQVIQYEVEAESRRNAIGGGGSQEGRAEAIVGHGSERPLDVDLRLSIWRYRVEGGFLVKKVRSRCAVIATRRRIKEALHPGALGQLRKFHRSQAIHLFGETGTIVSKRIIGQTRKMYDGVKSGDIVDFDVTDIFLDRGHYGGSIDEIAGSIEVCIKTRHDVPAFQKPRRQNRADIASMTGDQNLHVSFHVFQGILPESQICCRTAFSRSVSMHCQNDSWRYAIN